MQHPSLVPALSSSFALGQEGARVLTGQLRDHVGGQVTLSGWVHRLRQLSAVSFLILRDRAGLAQAVADDPALIAQLASLHSECVVEVAGQVIAEAAAPGGVELRLSRITTLAISEPPPFDLFRPAISAALPTQLDHAALALRHPKRRAAWRLGAAALRGFRAALDSAGFTEVQSPKIVASATESGANVFALDYFGRTAYLAQSPQFYKQMLVGVFERVYEVGPVFRAEPHDTPRHLNAYVSLDVELGFIADHTTVMATLTEVLRAMLGEIAASAGDALALLGVALPTLPTTIPALHFTEALDMIYRATGEDARAEPDLAPHHERWLGEWAAREHGSDFVFITGYPMVKRPFYTHPDPARPAYSNSFDLLFRGLELVTGGQRLHQHADVLAALAARGLPAEPFAGYLDAFKYGMPPHGGFAIGLERFIARLTGAANVREVALFPRDQSRLTP